MGPRSTGQGKRPAKRPAFSRLLRMIVPVALLVSAGLVAQPALYTQETKHFRVIYYSPQHEYLAPLLIRSLENAANFYREKFGYEPKGKITILIQDFDDAGYGGAGTVPINFIQIGLEPFNRVFETLPAAERMGLLARHELMHIVMGDETAPRDAKFRAIFGGKIMPNIDDPESILFSFMGNPRVYSPRWFHEGGAVFMETWMGGGFGRALGGYDEMVFRAMVRDDRYMYNVVGLESEGTSADFQVGANSYLYGTRFMNYLALHYGPEKLTEWLVRGDPARSELARRSPSRAYFESQFHRVYGTSLQKEWSAWIADEHVRQQANLKLIRQFPVTPVKPVSPTILGSISRSYYDAESRVIYAGVRHTGAMPYIAAIHPDTGKVERLTDVRGGAVYDVTSMAFDPEGRRIFFSTNNSHALRSLRVLDLRTRKQTVLWQNARMGDLVFNRADKSLWGVMHNNGLSILLRMEAPYKAARVVYTFPYATELSNLDISPDGASLTGALVDESGTQRLVRYSTADLLAGKQTPELLHDFHFDSPDSFSFSADGRYLYGSSYLTGASNLFRFNLDTKKLEALSNSETGLFRPLPLPDGSLAAFEYSSRGFRLVSLPVQVLEDVNAIPYLGQTVVEKHPELKSWNLPSRNTIDDLKLRTYAGFYKPLHHPQLQSIYPIAQGYQDAKAGGLRADFGDSLGVTHLTTTASYSPGSSSALRDRIHGSFDASYWNWRMRGYFNRADFYDLFGPTKVGRRGFGLVGQRSQTFIRDADRTLNLTTGLEAYSGLDRLPAYQNIAASHTQYVAATGELAYSDLQKSLGYVEDETGVQWKLSGELDDTFPRLFPHIWGEYTRGFLLPARNSSLWLRTAAGASFGDEKDPFANFYFGAFGNNWVDKGEVSRYRQYYSFPGYRINQIGAQNFIKAQAEWDLTPLHFRNLGNTRLYSNWARLALFTGALGADPANDHRTGYFDGGLQMDLRLVWFSQVKSTFSTGFAAATDNKGNTGTEYMFSLRIY